MTRALVTGDDHYRLGRMLRNLERQVIGITACGPEIDTVAAARHLARALQLASGQAVAVLLPGGPPAGAVVAVADQVDEVVEMPFPWAHRPLHALDEALALLRRSYGHVLVPWRDIEARGDHLAAAMRMDGVLVIARAGAAREAQLLAKHQELEGRSLGIILVG